MKSYKVIYSENENYNQLRRNVHICKIIQQMLISREMFRIFKRFAVFILESNTLELKLYRPKWQLQLTVFTVDMVIRNDDMQLQSMMVSVNRVFFNSGHDNIDMNALEFQAFGRRGIVKQEGERCHGNFSMDDSCRDLRPRLVLYFVLSIREYLLLCKHRGRMANTMKLVVSAIIAGSNNGS